MRKAPFCLLAVALLFSYACASNPQPEAPAAGDASAVAEQTGIRIVNDHPAFLDAVIFIVPQTGVKQMIGNVKGGETRQFAEALASGNYTLEQQRSDGTFRSERFYVPGSGALVTWHTSNNRVQVGR